jgi:hypothetical protein
MSTDTRDRWIKASRSASDNNCVEMRRRVDLIEVRDSKYPDGPALGYTPAEFAAWLDGAKKGEFDHLA